MPSRVIPNNLTLKGCLPPILTVSKISLLLQHSKNLKPLPSFFSEIELCRETISKSIPAKSNSWFVFKTFDFEHQIARVEFPQVLYQESSLVLATT